MPEDAELEDLLKFDIFEFLESQNKVKRIAGIRYNTPPAIVRYKMEEFYLVPKLASVNMYGEVSL